MLSPSAFTEISKELVVCELKSLIFVNAALVDLPQVVHTIKCDLTWPYLPLLLFCLISLQTIIIIM